MMEIEKINKFLLGSTCLLLGVLIGFLLSPIKKGIYCGNHSGNHSKNSFVPDDSHWMNDDEDYEEEADYSDEDDMPF